MPVPVAILPIGAKRFATPIDLAALMNSVKLI